jgi:hypothetical protein
VDSFLTDRTTTTFSNTLLLEVGYIVIRFMANTDRNICGLWMRGKQDASVVRINYLG